MTTAPTTLDPVSLPSTPPPARAVVECALEAAAQRRTALQIVGPPADGACFHGLLDTVRAADPEHERVPVEVTAHATRRGLLVVGADHPELDLLAAAPGELLVVPRGPHEGGAVVVGVTESTPEAVVEAAFAAAGRAGARLVAVRARGDGDAPPAWLAHRRLDLVVGALRERHPGVRTRTVVTESAVLDDLSAASTTARLVVVGAPSAPRGSRLTVSRLAERLRCPFLVVAAAR